MKNTLMKYYIAAAYLCSTFVMMAQPGDGTEIPGDIDAPDPGAPIDNYVILLAIAGIVFAFMFYKSNQVKKA